MLDNDHDTNRYTIVGSRPSVADFALFGQLRTLATDPTPMALMRKTAQRTESWLRQLDDLSGLEGEWLSNIEQLPEATLRLLKLIAEIYLPFLTANAKAFERGDDWFQTELQGQPYAQAPFHYQVKCLVVLKARFAALEPEVRERLLPILEETGCLSATC